MRLKDLSLKDKAIFNKFLGLKRHQLSVYAFENIYIWKALFDIRWLIYKDTLCVFFEDKIGCFLYLAPLGRDKDLEVIKKVFQILDKYNRNKELSRIENIGGEDVKFYQGLGFECAIKSCDYLCQRVDLAGLKGNKFKSKRSPFNYFVKHNQFEYLPFDLKHRDECLELYTRWMRQRKAKNKESLYQGMLNDSRTCLKIVLKDFSQFKFKGRVVKINKEIKAFTFGFRLSRHTFTILYEVADLSIKGLPQFIFRQFCRELTDYQYINIMDDSGLDNLRRVKLSYQPIKLIPAYIVKRKCSAV